MLLTLKPSRLFIGRLFIGRLFILSAVFMALSACASGAKNTSEDWLLNTPAQYSNQNYLLGRGQARSLEAAKDRARADIAKQFRVDISALTSNRTDVSANISAKGTQEDVTQKTSDAVESRSDLVLNGIEIVKTEKDENAPENARYAVLAVLNKAAAADALSSQIAALDSAARNHIKAEQQAEPNLALTRIRSLSSALNAQKEKIELGKLLQVLRSNANVAPIIPLADLQGQIQKLKNTVTLRLTLPDNAMVGNAARTALAQSGLTQSANGRYHIIVETNINELVQREKQFLATGNLSVRIEFEGELASSCRWLLRRVASSEAFAKALIEQSIGDDLTQFFNSVFNAQSLKECS